MEAVSTQTFFRMSPRKLRLVADSVKKMTPASAIEVLPYSGKRASEPLAKVIRSAVANAIVLGANVEKLAFKEIQIGQGPTLKRGISVSRGQWHPIKKRMSHIRVVVHEVEPKTKKNATEKKEVVTVEAPAVKTKKVTKKTNK